MDSSSHATNLNGQGTGIGMVTLVTGATGLLGNNVVRSLLDRGMPVRVLTRDNSDERPFAGLQVQVARGDMRDRDAVSRAVEGVSCVIHAAGYVHIGWRGLEQARSINVEGTRHIAEAARAAKAKFVHVSSLDALGTCQRGRANDEETPLVGGVPCPYVLTKREGEQVILDLVAAGLDARIVNPGYMIGPYDWKPSSGRMLLQVAKGWGLFAPLGANCYCDVRDVASGIVAAIDRGSPGRRYILAGPSLSYFQAWRVFARATGATPPVFPAGPILRIAAGRVGDMVTTFTGREPDVNSAATAIAAQKRNFSSARAEQELGYRPRPLLESAADAWHWFRQNGYV
jgi:dihydroflavonol-4-reductase